MRSDREAIFEMNLSRHLDKRAGISQSPNGFQIILKKISQKKNSIYGCLLIELVYWNLENYFRRPVQHLEGISHDFP